MVAVTHIEGARSPWTIKAQSTSARLEAPLAQNAFKYIFNVVMLCPEQFRSVEAGWGLQVLYSWSSL